MSTVKQYDYLNRLTSISNLDTQARNLGSFAYAYNPANQRTAVTNADSARWVYSYDKLGQVISGRRYWADNTPVTGQQFEYTFDGIGNRKTTGVGGDWRGQNLHPASYAANLLNQYTSRTVPGYVPMLGTANSNATVTLWGNDGSYAQTTRKGDYFRGEILVNNSTGAVWLTVTNVAVLQNGTNADIVSSVSGSALVPQTLEAFAYDYDGNLTSDGLWALAWDAENRVTTFESAAGLPFGAKRKVVCAYDHAWRRTEKITSTNNGSAYFPATTNRFIYDGWNLIARLDGGGNVLETYAWGLDLSGTLEGAGLARQSGASAGGVGGLLWVASHAAPVASHFAAYDGNGNVAGLVNAADGTRSAQYEYSPFGEVIRATGPMAKANPFRFSTQYQDDETDLQMYVHRPYRASTGRFLSRDPLGERAFLLSFLSGPFPDEAKALVGETVWDLMRVESLHTGYVFLDNDPLLKTDYLGLFGAGHNGRAGPSDFKGHSDFTAQGCFDYNLEDTNRETKPFPGGKPENHFQDKGTSTKQVEAAVKACDASVFERAMHRLQDFWSHYNKGYRWNPPWQLGHALAGTKPDEDNAAWAEAEKATKEWVEKFHKACPCTKCKAPGATP